MKQPWRRPKSRRKLPLKTRRQAYWQGRATTLEGQNDDLRKANRERDQALSSLKKHLEAEKIAAVKAKIEPATPVEDKRSFWSRVLGAKGKKSNVAA